MPTTNQVEFFDDETAMAEHIARILPIQLLDCSSSESAYRQMRASQVAKAKAAAKRKAAAMKRRRPTGYPLPFE